MKCHFYRDRRWLGHVSFTSCQMSFPPNPRHSGGWGRVSSSSVWSLEAANQTLASAAKLAARENVPDHSDQTVAFPAWLHGNLCCNANLLLIKERYHGREEDLDESFNYFVSRPDGEWPGSPPPPMPWWMLSTWSTMTGAETQRPKRRKIPTLGTNI